MPYVTAKDGAQIFYKDWGTGTPVVFSHGWPLNADAWDPQMMFLGNHGFRVIAHDRRGHGRSSQTWDGNEMDTYADDLAALFDHLHLHDAVLVGHSTGGGEVAHYLGRHGSSRVQKAVLISAVTPGMVRSASNPGGVPPEVFDDIRAKTLADRSQYFKDLTLPFYGYNRDGAIISEGVRENFWYQGMQGGIKGLYDCIAAFSATDFTADLKSLTIPVLILHGDDDQIVPIDVAGKRAHSMIAGSTLKIMPGLSHGMCTVNADAINGELLTFLQG